MFVCTEYICAASVFADLCGTCFKTWAAMYYISFGEIGNQSFRTWLSILCHFNINNNHFFPQTSYQCSLCFSCVDQLFRRKSSLFNDADRCRGSLFKPIDKQSTLVLILMKTKMDVL